MARTTLDIEPTVLAELKTRAAAENKSLGQTASELLALALREGRSRRRKEPLRWTTTGGPLLVDILDKDAVERALDDEDDERKR